MGKIRNILGLAFEDRCILAAEVHMRGGKAHLRQSGELVIADGMSQANPSELGRQLRQFLKANHFSAKAAVVGLPAKWLIAKALSVPPTSASALSGILNIQAERAFSLDPKDLVFDYYGRSNSAESSTLLLMATHGRRISHISALAKAAGLQLIAITPTSHALRSIESDNDSDLAIYVRDDYLEFWSPKADLPWIRHGARSAWQTQKEHDKALQTEISRLLWLSPRDGPGSGPHNLTLYTSSALDGKWIESLNRSLSAQAAVAEGGARLRSVKLDAGDMKEAGASGAAAALALAGLRERKLFVDFLHSRMVPKKKITPTRTLVWAAVACVAVVAVSVAAVWDWRTDRRDIATYTEQLSAMSGDIEAARQVVERMSYAAGWTSRRPEFLECLRQLTQTFPEQGSVWATNLALRENGQGLVTGKSLAEGNVLAVLDAIKLNKVFQDVQMLYMRDAGRDTDEVSFAISFRFSGGR